MLHKSSYQASSKANSLCNDDNGTEAPEDKKRLGSTFLNLLSILNYVFLFPVILYCANSLIPDVLYVHLGSTTFYITVFLPKGKAQQMLIKVNNGRSHQTRSKFQISRSAHVKVIPVNQELRILLSLNAVQRKSP